MGRTGKGANSNLHHKKQPSSGPLNLQLPIWHPFSATVPCPRWKRRIQKHPTSPLPSDRGAETHQFHIRLLVVEHQSPHSSSLGSAFRFNLAAGRREHRGTCSLSFSRPCPGHPGKSSPPKACRELWSPLPLLSKHLLTQIHLRRQSILPLRPSMISCPPYGPGTHGILGRVVPAAPAPFTPPPCGKADGRGPCREL